MTEDISDTLIDAIATIANHKTIKEICEPNIMQPLQVEAWQVKRTLTALHYFQDELRLMNTKRKEIKPQ